MAQIQDIGVDLGTSNVLVYMRGRGIVLREPAVVAVDRDLNRVLAVGADAYRLMGRTPGNIQAIRPLRQGSILDYDLVKTLLTDLMSRIVGKRLLARPRAVLSVPSGGTSFQTRKETNIIWPTFSSSVMSAIIASMSLPPVVSPSAKAGSSSAAISAIMTSFSIFFIISSSQYRLPVPLPSGCPYDRRGPIVV